MNPNLMNPAIVTRAAEERESLLRRESHAPRQGQVDFTAPTELQPIPAPRPSRRPLTFFARLLTFAAR